MLRFLGLMAAFYTAADAASALKSVARPEPITALYRSQLLPDLEVAVGDVINFAGADIPASIDDKGTLTLDLKKDGKPKKLAASGMVSLAVGGAVKNAQVAFRKSGKTWTYRNATQLSALIGGDVIVIVDANCNGIYNEPGVDGMTWKGYSWLFPLPGADESWCTPSATIVGCSFGPAGEKFTVTGSALATMLPQTLDVLRGINLERVNLGLTPRPEDPSLSAPLQAHCHYMSLNDVLQHPEDPSKPGYTKEGHDAGMSSILSSGGANGAGGIAAQMVETYFHRQDVIRPYTMAFGVGYEGHYGGIDGRRNLASHSGPWLPILCPVPDQKNLPIYYGKETPDATPGDAQSGYAITVYFGTSNLNLTKHALTVKGSNAPIDCYLYDPHTGASNEFSGWQHSVALIAKDPLQYDTTYEVMLEVSVDGTPWTKTWNFTTESPPARGGRY
jgi:hypothetical protein